MARQIKPLVQKVAGAQVRAPSAPSAPRAPGLRNIQGSMAAAQPGLNSTQINQSKTGGGLGQRLGGIGAGLTQQVSKPGKLATETKPRTGGGPAIDPRDSTYWNNVAALDAQLDLGEMEKVAADTAANIRFRQESERMQTNRERSRRNLAESLVGLGSIYSGQHRRTQLEGDHDYLLDRDRLDTDYRAEQAARDRELHDLRGRVGEGGTERERFMLEAEDRETKRLQEQAEKGAPVGKPKKTKKRKPEEPVTAPPGVSGGAKPPSARERRITTMNTTIKRLRRRIRNTDNPKVERRLRNRVHKVRRRRDRLKGKA